LASPKQRKWKSHGTLHNLASANDVVGDRDFRLNENSDLRPTSPVGLGRPTGFGLGFVAVILILVL